MITTLLISVLVVVWAVSFAGMLVWISEKAWETQRKEMEAQYLAIHRAIRKQVEGEPYD